MSNRQCECCGYPAKRGILPIIWPDPDSGRDVYCSVFCFESRMKMRLPEPYRTLHLAAEKAAE